MRVAKTNADTSMAYYNAMVDRISRETSDFEITKLKYEMLSVKLRTSDNIAEYKEFERKYLSTKDRIKDHMELEKFEQLYF